MRARKKFSKKRKRMRKVVVSLIVLIVTIIVFFELTVKDRIELAIIAQVKSVSQNTINRAVSEYINSNLDYGNQMIEINVDENGSVKSIYENSLFVNKLKTDIIEVSLSSVNNVMDTHGIDVQLGNFTGLTILSEFGPYISMDIDATTSINCEIVSTFEACGVNQTLHRLQLEMFVDIYIGNPIRIESIAYDTSYEIAQTVIIGNIPSVYGTISRY